MNQRDTKMPQEMGYEQDTTKFNRWKNAKLPFMQTRGRAQPICKPESRLLRVLRKLTKETKAAVSKEIPHAEEVDAGTKRYSRPYAVALHFGRFWGPYRTNEYRQKQRECFSNSMGVVLADSSLTYVEGWAIAADLPCFPLEGRNVHDLAIEHAWCVDRVGGVYDVTWRHPGMAYFGVAFERRPFVRICQQMEAEGWITPILPRLPHFFPKVAW